MSIIRFIIVLLIATLLFFTAFSQRKVESTNHEIGFWLGSATYIGDLNPEYSPKKMRPALGFIYRFNVNPHVSLKATASGGMLAGADSVINKPYQVARNLSFRTLFVETSGQVELNFHKFIPGDLKHYISPYLTTGLAVMYFNPKAKLNDKWHTLNELGTEGQTNTDFTGRKKYSRLQLAIPIGFGVKCWIANAWNFYAELAYRQTFTDYLDDVSSQYIDNFLLGGSLSETAQLADRSDEVMSKPIGIEGKQRGDITTNDGYVVLNLGLTYTIFNRKCPTSK